MTPSQQSWTSDVVCRGKAVELYENHRLTPFRRALAVSVLSNFSPVSTPCSTIIGVIESMTYSDAAMQELVRRLC